MDRRCLPHTSSPPLAKTTKTTEIAFIHHHQKQPLLFLLNERAIRRFDGEQGNRRRAKLPASTNCRQKMANLHIEGVVRGQWAWFNKWRVLESTLKSVYLLFIDKRRQFPLY